MARAYSLDLRQRAFDAWQRGDGTQAQVAVRFQISASCLRDLSRRFRESGQVAAKPRGGGRRPLASAATLEQLAGQAAARNDDTIEEHRVSLAEAGYHLSHTTVSRVLLQLGLTRKKRRAATTKPAASGCGDCAGTSP